MKKLVFTLLTAFMAVSALGQQFLTLDWSPASPAILSTNDIVYVDFTYTKPDGEVLVFAQPFFQGSFEYRIFNLQGSLMIKGIAHTRTIRISTSDLPEGTYLIRVTSDLETVSKLIIKK
jgi:hypothetical protein